MELLSERKLVAKENILVFAFSYGIRIQLVR
jgi:hypothetical protein